MRKDRNKSEEIFIALNSTKSDKVGKFDETMQDKRGVRNLLEILDLKINERFTALADAFRIFDKNFDGRITFKEFIEGINFLGCDFSIGDCRKVFDFLDKNHDQALDYIEFCELCEEKR